MSNVHAAGYKKLARLLARTFYSGECPPKHYRDDEDDTPEVLPGRARKPSRAVQVDTNHLGIVVMDALTRREWVDDSILASELGLHHKQVRRVLKFLESEQVLMAEHVRQTKRKLATDALNIATGLADAEDAELQQSRLHSYYAIDYGRMYDMLQYRLHTMRARILEQTEGRSVVQRYRCLPCSHDYSSLEAASLLDLARGALCCAICGEELSQIADERSGAVGDLDSIRQNRDALKALLVAIDIQLAPLHELMASLRGTVPPDPGSVSEWANRRTAIKRAAEQAAAGGRPGGGGGGSGARHGAGPTIDDYSARTDVKISLDGFGGGAAGAGGSGRGGKGAPKLAPKPTLDSWRAGQAAAAAQPAAVAPQPAAAPEQLSEADLLQAYHAQVLQEYYQRQAAEQAAAAAATATVHASAQPGAAGRPPTQPTAPSTSKAVAEAAARPTKKARTGEAAAAPSPAAAAKAVAAPAVASAAAPLAAPAQAAPQHAPAAAVVVDDEELEWDDM